MKIELIAFDSLGVRSMCTFVETKDTSILIDPSASLAPNKFGLPPHPKEIERLNELWQLIVKKARKAKVLIISHYHYDHYNPNRPELFKGKIVLLKDPKKNINKSQTIRAKEFLEKIEGIPKKIEYVDGKSFTFGKTKINFSKAVPHGINSKLGFVVETSVMEKNFKLLHTSDVEGPALKEQVEFILKEKPNFLIVDGPLSCMLGFRYPVTALNESIKNMLSIIDRCPIKTFILEHHFLRDAKWKERAKKIFEKAEKKKIKILTAAEFNNKPIEVLELKRKELYEKFPAKKIKKVSSELLP
ncbi:hypothetical protein B6U82_01605 [Candidatus Pacearchaeota archaeon ex4484_31]|nr:MAG: hypothetical protein B6U82_01605 [Candidatus Pacearchaeota archaeon ex4484_31]